MIHKIERDNFVLVRADSGKLKIKGINVVFSEATESKGNPKEYVEVKK